jgi:hypothetical protein
MGGNRIVLLDGREIAEGRELTTALAALDESEPPGHQAGIVYPEADDRLRVRVVSVSWRDFIPACGGLTQVLGVALEGTAFADRLGLRTSGERAKVSLAFDAWPVALTLHRAGGRVTRVDADLTAFLNECRRDRVGPVDLDGVRAMQVGTFLVLNADRLSSRYPGVDIPGLDEPARALLTDVHRRFQEITKLESWDFALYDWHPERGGDLRVVFPHAIGQGHIEPACGTGSAAVAVALFESGEASRRLEKTDRPHLKLESGGGADLGGPDLTTTELELESGHVTRVSFHHDNVEITEEGTLAK